MEELKAKIQLELAINKTKNNIIGLKQKKPAFQRALIYFKDTSPLTPPKLFHRRMPICTYPLALNYIQKGHPQDFQI